MISNFLFFVISNFLYFLYHVAIYLFHEISGIIWWWTEKNYVNDELKRVSTRQYNLNSTIAFIFNIFPNFAELYLKK